MADLLEQAHDAVDKFVTGIGNALGVDFDGETDDADIRVRVSTLPPALPPASSRLALPAPSVATEKATPAFEIIERDGRVCVTNGITGQVCPSRAYAEQVLAAMNAAMPAGRSGRR